MKTLVIWAVILLAGCGGSSDPCERWLVERFCFVGHAYCDQGQPKVSCLHDKKDQRRFWNAEMSVGQVARKGEVFNIPANMQDACSMHCWELTQKEDHQWQM